MILGVVIAGASHLFCLYAEYREEEAITSSGSQAICAILVYALLGYVALYGNVLVIIESLSKMK